MDRYQPIFLQLLANQSTLMLGMMAMMADGVTHEQKTDILLKLRENVQAVQNVVRLAGLIAVEIEGE